MGCAARAPEANAQLMLIVRIVFNTLSQNTGRAAGCHLAEGVAIRLPRAEERALPASPVAHAEGRSIRRGGGPLSLRLPSFFLKTREDGATHSEAAHIPGGKNVRDL